MTVNNSAKIGTMLKFGPDDFYFLQILKRRKDNPDMEKSMVVIKNFYIDSLEDYIKLVPRIIEICDTENARAYIRLKRRNYTHLGLKLIKRAVDYISNNNHKALRNVFDAVAGEFHSEKDKTWLIDIDWSTYLTEDEVVKVIRVICELQIKTGREPMTEILPSKNGVHLITRPFNKMVFKELYPNIDIHTDNPTILYCS